MRTSPEFIFAVPTRDCIFIAFEFVEGENLRTILERDGPLPVAKAVDYLLQIATGLIHACRTQCRPS
ncbi:MAG: hypothetical protein KatS3mg105_0853 [Gemmatales bacterium]|nr:MAG: hypothetical protein KatS3mg105_0853 [Gemmatales bacterium]